VVGLLLLAALVFGAYFTTWVLSRDAYFTTRNFRILAGLSKQIESIIAVHSDGLRYGALGQQVEEPARQAAELSISYRGSADAQETRRLRLTSGVAPPPKETKADEDTGKPLLGFEAYPEGAYLETVRVKNPRRLKLEPLIDPILARDVFDHVVVADGNGNVLFEKENREIRLTSLAGLVRDGGGKAGDGGPLHGRQATARIRKVDISGVSYDLFISPLQVPVAREKENEGVGPWLVCGLKRSDVFREDSLALPRRPLIGFVLLVVVILLSWPLIKLRSMRGWEHLSRLDLTWLAGSLFLIPALMTLAIWGGWRFHSLHDLWDHALRGVADRIAANFAADVRAYEGLLAEADRGFSPGDTAHGPSLASRSVLDRLPFNDFYWIRQDGCQAYKISFGMSKPLIGVRDREYFQALARDVHPGDAAGSPRAFVESVSSWTTGEPELVVALRRPQDAEVPVAAVATPLPSLIDAVLPPGFEYAVVQNRREVQGSPGNPRTAEIGDVLLHSDKRRNLRENLLQETTDSSWLSADLAGGASGWGSLVYQGQSRRAYTRPLSIGDRPWSLVVLTDEDVLTGFDLQVATNALELTFLYGLAVGLLLFAYSRLRGRSGADWLWPQRERLPGYTALIGLLVALVLIYLYVLASQGSDPALWFIALFPLAVLGGLHEALSRPLDESRRNLRIVVAVEVLFLAGPAILRTGAPAGTSLLWLLAAAALAGLAAAGPEISAALDGGLAALRERWGSAQPARWRWSVDRPWHRYLVCLLLGGILLAVLPTLSFFNLVFDRQVDGLVRRTLLDLGGSLQEREKRLAKDLGNRLPGSGGELAEAALDVGPGPAAGGGPAARNGQCAGSSEPYPGARGMDREAQLATRLTDWLGFERRHDYAHLLLDTCVCYEERTPKGPPAHFCSCREPARVRAVTRAGGCPRAAVRTWIETASFSPAAVRGGDASGWQVRSYADAGGQDCYELPIADGPGGPGAITLVTRAPTGDLAPADPGQAALLGGVALLAGWIFFLLIRFVTSMLFFQGVAGAVPVAAGPPRLHLALDRSDLPDLEAPPPGSGWRLLDFQEIARAPLDPRFAPDRDDQVIVLDHFDLPGEAAGIARELVLRAAASRRLILLCDQISRLPLGRRRDGPEADLPRLGTLLARDGDSFHPLEGEELAPRLREDPGLIPDVEVLERWFVAGGGDQRHVLDLLGEAMRPAYQARWRGLGQADEPGGERSQEDKLILRALVHGQLITAKAGRRLRRLAAGGFITQDPGVRIVSLSQRIFIRDQTAREGREIPALLGEQSEWSRLKIPLSVTVVLLLAFLFLTQRELFESTVAMVGALGGGVAAVLQLFSGLGSAKAGKRHD
jgi:hypothetical protein